MRPLKSKRRRGVALVLVLILLIVASIATMSALKVIGMQKSWSDDQARRAQAEWLAESGLDRAAARLAADAAYPGEVWTVPAEALDGRRAGVVRIAVAPLQGDAARRTIRVEADFPADSDRRARSSRTATVATRAATEGP